MRNLLPFRFRWAGSLKYQHYYLLPLLVLATVLSACLETRKAQTKINLWLVVLRFLVFLGRAVQVWFRLVLKNRRDGGKITL